MIYKIFLSLIFAALGILSSFLILVVLSLPTSEPLRIDALNYWCFVLSLFGPIIWWTIMKRFTKSILPSKRKVILQANIIGLTISMLIELAYIIPLGIVYLAYHGVKM